MAAARDSRRDAEQLLGAVQIACDSGDMDALNAALASGIPIEASHREVSWGYTCMHLASSLGNAEVVRYLLQNGGGRLLHSCGSMHYTNYPISLVESADVMFTLLEFHPELAPHRFFCTESILCRATRSFVRGKGGWTLDKIKRLVEEHRCPVDAPPPLGGNVSHASALDICFYSAISPNARALFWYLARERHAALTDNSSYLSHFRSLAVTWRVVLSEEGRCLDETPPEAYDDLMRYLIVERGLNIDEAGKHETALSLAVDFERSEPAALLIRWGASLWPVLLRPDGYRMLSPKGAATIKDAIRQRAYAKRARLVAAYRYPRKHSNVRRWERGEERRKQPDSIETETATGT
jgi:Ankyrin repeat